MKIPYVNGIPFRSKEVSWLSFNERVLQEAENPSLPLLERLKFLGIYSSNMDEFFRVRVATLRRLQKVTTGSSLGNMPDTKRTLNEVLAWVKKASVRVDALLARVTKEMLGCNVQLVDDGRVPREHVAWVKEYFHKEVLPRMMPVMIRSYSEFGDLRDNLLYLAVELKSKAKSSRTDHALLEIPTHQLPRFVVLPEKKGKTCVMYLEDIIRHGLPAIFAGLKYDSFEAWAVKFSRDAEMSVDDDITESLIDRIASGLKTRESGRVVRMIHDRVLPVSFRALLLGKLKLQPADGQGGYRYQNRRDFLRFPKVAGLTTLPNLAPVPHKRFQEAGRNIFKALQRSDILLHFPYHSFHLFLDFLRQACIDPMVLAIRITQYRLARESSVAKALMKAAQNGKFVQVLVEPQARFDEQNNMQWASEYQEAGVKVGFGLPNIKVHAKVCLVTRSEGGKEVGYAAIGTGNFNEDTSRLYTDHMLLTARKSIVSDVEQVFQFFQNIYKPPILQQLVASPFHMREGLVALIDAEKQAAAAGKPAGIFLKLNNLSDFEMVRQLYLAAQAGVKIRIICRGMFSLVTGLKSWSQHIEARSIVDGYLEHSRLAVFENSGDPKVFLTSADFLARNLDRRFELLCPVIDKKLRNQLINYLELQWGDCAKGRVLDKTLSNCVPAAATKESVPSQWAIRRWLAEEVM